MKITIMKKAAFVFCTLLMTGCFNEGVDPARITAFSVTNSNEPMENGVTVIEMGATGHFNVAWTVEASPYEYSLYLNNSANLNGNEVLLEEDKCGQSGYDCGLTRIIRCESAHDNVDGINISSIACDNNTITVRGDNGEDTEVQVKTHVNGLLDARSGELYMILKACNGQRELCRTASKKVKLTLRPQLSSFSILPNELFEQGSSVAVTWEAKQVVSEYTIGLRLIEVNEVEGKSVIAKTKEILPQTAVCDNSSASCGAENEALDYLGRLACTVENNAGAYQLNCTGGAVDTGIDDITDLLSFAVDDSLSSVDVANFVRHLQLTICDTTDALNCNTYTESLKIIQDRPLVTLSALPRLRQGAAESPVEWQARMIGDTYAVAAVAAVAAVEADPDAVPPVEAVAAVEAVDAVAASFSDYEFKIFASDDETFKADEDSLMTSLLCVGVSCGDATDPNNGTRAGKVSCSNDADFKLSCNGGVDVNSVDVIAPVDLSVSLPKLPFEASADASAYHYLIAQTCKDNNQAVKLCTHQAKQVTLDVEVADINSFDLTSDSAETPVSKTSLVANDNAGHSSAEADHLRLKWDVNVKAEAGETDLYYVNVYVRSGNDRDALLDGNSDPQNMTHDQLEATARAVTAVACDSDNCSSLATKPTQNNYGELDCSLNTANELKCGDSAALDVAAHVTAGNMYLFLEVCNKADKMQCRYKVSPQVTLTPAP